MHIKTKAGFTLVEIMIVVVIIGLLAAMAIPAFQKVRMTSMEKALDNELRQLAQAADQYFIENGVTTVGIGSLYGTDKYIKNMDDSAYGDAVYPNTITQGTDIVITGTPIGNVSIDF